MLEAALKYAGIDLERLPEGFGLKSLAMDYVHFRRDVSIEEVVAKCCVAARTVKTDKRLYKLFDFFFENELEEYLENAWLEPDKQTSKYRSWAEAGEAGAKALTDFVQDLNNMLDEGRLSEYFGEELEDYWDSLSVELQERLELEDYGYY